MVRKKAFEYYVVYLRKETPLQQNITKVKRQLLRFYGFEHIFDLSG